MKKGKFFQKIIGPLSLCFLLTACTQAKLVNNKETDLSDFHTITPVIEVEVYRFVADGNAAAFDGLFP
ncbi:hypothetical protein ACTGZQ_11085 [Streptococcus suis]